MKRKCRKKLPKIKTIRNKLWEATKTIVRDLHKGYIHEGWDCYTCGKILLEPKQVHTGHLIPRATGGLLLYYHLDALRPQCYTCNRGRGGEGALFMYKLIGELGMDKISMLIGLIGRDQKPTREFFQGLLDERLEDVKNLGI